MLPLMFLMLLMVPAAQCFTIDNPLFNFQATHGGNVRYANAVVSTQIKVVNAITQFNTLIIGGNNRGSLAFDCDTGSVMVITGVTLNTVQYTITAVGQVDSYVYFGNRLYEPVGTNTDAVTYVAGTGQTTVTTTGNVAVTLTYSIEEGNRLELLAKQLALNYQAAIYYALFGIGIMAAAGSGAINGSVDMKVIIGLLLAWVLGAIIVGVLITA